MDRKKAIKGILASALGVQATKETISGISEALQLST